MKLATPNAEKKTANSAAVGSAATPPSQPAANPKSQDEMLTKQEMAARFKVSVRTIENWLNDGFLPRIRITTRVIRFYWPEVVAHLLKNSSGPGPKVPPDGTNPRPNCKPPRHQGRQEL